MIANISKYVLIKMPKIDLGKDHSKRNHDTTSGEDSACSIKSRAKYLNPLFINEEVVEPHFLQYIHYPKI